MQKEIKINDVKIPIIEESEVIYYPISYMGDKILLKDLTANQLIRNGYGEYIKQLNIDYGEYTGGIQNTYCISESGLKVILKKSKIGRLSIEQKRAMNKVLEYLGLDLIMEDERFIKNLEKVKIIKYSGYIQDCINDVLKDNPNIIWQKCGKCNNYYPYHINFFRDNPHAGHEYPLYTNCRDCKWTEGRSKDWIRLNDNKLTLAYRKYGEEMYQYYKKHDILYIYNYWIDNGENNMPYIINNEEDKLFIIKHLYNNGYFDKYNEITSNIIHKVCKFRVDGNGFIIKIHKELFGCYLKNGSEYIDDIKSAKETFFNYIKNNNIIIDNNNIYNVKYDELISKSKLRGYLNRKCNNNLLTLIMNLFDNKYSAYKFRITGNKYWELKDNRVIALKYLIEEDMKTPIDKIPLYLTLTTIRKIPNNDAMYNLLRKYYKSNLWEWVNEVYPGKFIEEDFNIGVIRNSFDSAEEHTIHDILFGKFKNVLYNQRNTKNTIRILGMEPDWFIFTDNGVWVVEYFGISNNMKDYNTRITYYKKKTLKKIGKYEGMKWLGKVYIYPEDLKDNFKGLEEKLKVIV